VSGAAAEIRQSKQGTLGKLALVDESSREVVRFAMSNRRTIAPHNSRISHLDRDGVSLGSPRCEAANELFAYERESLAGRQH
jgi:hypothetical protein